MKKLTGSDIIALIKSSMKDDTLKGELKALASTDFDNDDILVKFFFRAFPEGFRSSGFHNADSDSLTAFAGAMFNIKKEISNYGLRKAHNLLQNVRDASDQAVAMDNEVNEAVPTGDASSQIKAAQLVNFLSKYVDGHPNREALAGAVEDINAGRLKEASENIHAVYARNYPEKNVKLAFTTLKNQMGESYQLCAKGIYHSGYPVPMPVSSCREYCIDVRKNPDGTVGCNYLKWLNENLTTNEQAMNFFDKIPVEHEKMNLEDGERSRFPMSDQDSQETKVRRLDKLENEPFEKQLDKFHGKEKKAEKLEETPDEAIESLLKDAREAFDEDDLDTLEQLLREAMGE